MSRWHGSEAEKSCLRHAAVDAKGSDRRKPGGRGGGEVQPY